jgi:hypothetical protein
VKFWEIIADNLKKAGVGRQSKLCEGRQYLIQKYNLSYMADNRAMREVQGKTKRRGFRRDVVR